MVSSVRTLRTLAVSIIAASCTVAPTATSTIGTVPTATSTGGVLPTTAPPIGTAWERTEGIAPAQVRHTELRDVAAGPNGFVVVGAACPGNPCPKRVAVSWFSADGRTWSEVEVPDGAGVELTTVAADDSTWFAAGLWHEDGFSGPRTEARVWRSADAQSWSLVGSFAIGDCFEGCPGFEQLVAGPGGLVLSWVHAPGTRSTAYWSRDGETWTPVDKAMLGVPTRAHIPSSEAVVINGRFVMAGPHGGCASVWSSMDGRDWTVDDTVCPANGALDIATDGMGAVVVSEDCSSSGCVTRTFASDNARTGWTQGSKLLPIGFPQVTYTGSAFVLTGFTHPTQALAIYTSTDGVDWVKIDDSPGFGDCVVYELVAAPGRALFLGGDQRGCAGIWISEAPAI